MSKQAVNKDSMRNILVTAFSVCLVAAIVVSATAVALKPTRLSNKALDRNKNILIAAGLFVQDVTPVADINGLFEAFEIRIIDLKEQRLLLPTEAASRGIDLTRYDQKKAAKELAWSEALNRSRDIASISRRARYSVAFLLKNEGDLDRIVLPIHGYGLWSTLYGFIALEADLSTVSGITFYQHEETAGLGGEVDNPRWKANWVGKKIFNTHGDVVLTVVKGSVNPASKRIDHEVDGLSGATLTSRGVQNIVAFWLGPDGFGPLLKKLKG